MTIGERPVVFPPPEGQYSGDYIYITEPGHYSLEHPVSHTYPIGIIIAASSVVLDGQGYEVDQLGTGPDSSVGIWIRMTDTEGKPVTGVSIRNVSINKEDYGVYVEGSDTSEFGWGSNQSNNPGIQTPPASTRNLFLNGISITNCRDGVKIMEHPDVTLLNLSIEGSFRSGVVMNESSGRIVSSIISGSQKDGVEVHGARASEISSCTINQSGDAGINLDSVSGLLIFNNILENQVNIKADMNSTGIVLQTARTEGENIIGGTMRGGNFWISKNPKIPGSESIPDANLDGIGDSSYDPGIGIKDTLPLVMPKEGRIPTKTLIPIPQKVTYDVKPVQTPNPIQTPLSFISGFHAVITGDTIPSEMSIGKEYPVSLQLCNDGSDDWITGHQVGIKAFDESASYGPEWMAAPVSSPVHPGTVVSVNFTLRSPSPPGTHTLKYQAAREGSGVEILFGRPYTRTVSVH